MREEVIGGGCVIGGGESEGGGIKRGIKGGQID